MSFAQTREAELAWVDGRLVMGGTKFDTKDEKMDTDDEYRREVVPVLEQIPPEEVLSLINHLMCNLLCNHIPNHMCSHMYIHKCI